MRRRVSNALAVVVLEKGSRPLLWRWVAGTLVVLLAAVYVSAWINNNVEGGDWWGMTIGQPLTLWLAGFAAGCIVRQWRAALLALLPILVAIPFGLREDGGGWLGNPEPVAYYMAALAPICAAFIAGGVAAAGVVQARRRRGSAPAPG
jgi:hypothetical protein